MDFYIQGVYLKEYWEKDNYLKTAKKNIEQMYTKLEEIKHPTQKECEQLENLLNTIFYSEAQDNEEIKDYQSAILSGIKKQYQSGTEELVKNISIQQLLTSEALSQKELSEIEQDLNNLSKQRLRTREKRGIQLSTIKARLNEIAKFLNEKDINILMKEFEDKIDILKQIVQSFKKVIQEFYNDGYTQSELGQEEKLIEEIQKLLKYITDQHSTYILQGNDDFVKDINNLYSSLKIKNNTLSKKSFGDLFEKSLTAFYLVCYKEENNLIDRSISEILKDKTVGNQSRSEKPFHKRTPFNLSDGLDIKTVIETKKSREEEETTKKYTVIKDLDTEIRISTMDSIDPFSIRPVKADVIFNLPVENSEEVIEIRASAKSWSKNFLDFNETSLLYALIRSVDDEEIYKYYAYNALFEDDEQEYYLNKNWSKMAIIADLLIGLSQKTMLPENKDFSANVLIINKRGIGIIVKSLPDLIQTYLNKLNEEMAKIKIAGYDYEKTANNIAKVWIKTLKDNKENKFEIFLEYVKRIMLEIQVNLYYSQIFPGEEF